MRYKHDTLLPANAFRARGSVVGGRSLRLHGGDGMDSGIDWEAIRQAEEAAEQDRLMREGALWQASQGRMRLLEEYNRVKALEEASMRAAAARAEQDAINARNAYAAEQYRIEQARLQQEAERLAEQQRQAAAAYQAQQAAAAAEQQRQAQALQAQQAAAALAEQQRQQALAEQQRQAAAQQAAAQPPANQNSSSRNDMAITFDIESDNDSGARYLVSSDKKFRIEVIPTESGKYVARMGASGDSGADQYSPEFSIADLERQVKIAESVPFGTGMGPALGYAYETQNSEGNPFRRFDAQGNLTEFVDRHGKWQPVSVFKPAGIDFNPMTGQIEAQYKSPDSTVVRFGGFEPNKYREDQGGVLGEGGWANIGKLVLAGVSAGLAAPAMAAIQGATGLGTIASGALYGGLTGAASGALGGGAQGALQGGLLGAAGGGAMAALGGGGAEAFPVEAPSADFTGMSYADLNSLGVGEFQPFAGGDVGLGSGYITQFNPDGTFTTLAGAPDYSYTADAGAEAGEVVAEEFDPNARVLTAEEAENLMRYNILPADMQTPAVYDWLETPKALLGGEYGGLIKGGLTLGALAAANALKPQQETQTTGGGLTAAQLQALVSTMPSMIDQYAAQAQQGLAGMGQTGQGYTPAMGQAIAQLFPTFSLPTTGPFYGAGRFGEGYAPNAPIIKV